jgi:hypothetical protein
MPLPVNGGAPARFRPAGGEAAEGDKGRAERPGPEIAAHLIVIPAQAGIHLSKARAAEEWVPAFPTDQVRGLKAHGTTGLVFS